MSNELTTTCPYCMKSGHFYFNKIKELAHCFKCGINCSPATAKIDYLRGRQLEGKPAYIGGVDTSDVDLKFGSPLGVNSWIRYYYVDTIPVGESQEAKDWLINRPDGRISFEALDHGTKFGTNGPCKNRIIIPTWDFQGNLRGFNARTIGDDEPKYWRPPHSQSEFPHGLDKALIYHRKTGQPLIITEGPFDVLRLRTLGCWTGISLWGKSLQQKQDYILGRLISEGGIKQVLVWLDKDAQKEANTIKTKLEKWKVPVFVVKIFHLVKRIHNRHTNIPYKDPGSCDNPFVIIEEAMIK